MLSDFKGIYSFTDKILREWKSDVFGVYYLGIKTPQNQLRVYYIGKAIENESIREKLLQHLSENRWSDVTHFGFISSQPLNSLEVEKFEALEIKKYSPKYNLLSVSYV